MTRDTFGRQNRYSYNEGLITALSVGGFFIILGIVFGLTPGTWYAVSAFLSDLKVVHISTNSGLASLNLPAPVHTDAHGDFYSAVFAFCVGIGVLNLVVLALRLIFRSPIRRISNSVGDVIFWFGAAASVSIFLMAGTLTGWYQFWAVLLLIIGVSLIVRGIIHLAAWRTRKTLSLL